MATANFGTAVKMPKQLKTPGFSASKTFSFATGDDEEELADETKIMGGSRSNSSGDLSVSSMNSDTFKFGVARIKTFRKSVAHSEVSLPDSNSDSSCELNVMRRGSTASNLIGMFSPPVPQVDKETQTMVDETTFLQQNVAEVAEVRDMTDCGVQTELPYDLSSPTQDEIQKFVKDKEHKLKSELEELGNRRKKIEKSLTKT